jgi:transcriptional regulator with XRE-family HTH domain
MATVNANDTAPTGQSLRERRRAAGLSQQGLAELAHCSMDMVRRLEAGYRPTRRSAVLPRILRVLDGDAPPDEHDPPAVAGRVETVDGSHGASQQ